MKTYIGVDPGLNGGLAEISDEGIEIAVMPKIGTEISLKGIKEWFISRLARSRRENIVVGIENVHAIYGSAAGATFQFGRASMAPEMAAVMLDLPIVLVSPKDWQKIIHEGVRVIYKPDGKKKDTKQMSLQAAERLFPHVDLRATEKCKNAHDGLVDALLIAEYLRTQNR